jgi:uncharacterized SAM-binding protein YcdF (DUF218 family)
LSNFLPDLRFLRLCNLLLKGIRLGPLQKIFPQRIYYVFHPFQTAGLFTAPHHLDLYPFGGQCMVEEKKEKNCCGSIWPYSFLFSNAFLFNMAVRWWEVDTPEVFNDTDTYDVAILLGGYSDLNLSNATDLHHLSASGNRFHLAMQLYQQGKFKKWLLSGGSGRLWDQEKQEAIFVQDLLIRLGVDKNDIIIDPLSRNTHENAHFSRQKLEEYSPDGRYLLITSAWHMPRALACFEKEGLNVTPFSTDFKGKKVEFRPEPLLIPNAGTLHNWDFLIKEWVGYLVYWMKGYL